MHPRSRLAATPRRRRLLSAASLTGWLAVLVLVSMAVPGHAYRMLQNPNTGPINSGYLVACDDPGGFAHWTSPNVTFFHNLSGQGHNKAGALQSAMHSWNAVGSTSHVLSYGGTTNRGWSADGTNTVVWAYGNGCTGSCLALTMLVLQSGQEIVESDVTFNASYAWQTTGSLPDTEAVAAHEFGHSLGIHHTELTAPPLPTMHTPAFGVDGRTLEDDDEDALRCAEARYPFAAGPLGQPTGLTPAHSTADSTPTFSWTAVPQALYYRFAVQTTAGVFYYLPEPLPTATTYTPTLALQNGACYHWWVRAERAIGDHGPWSAMHTVCVTGPPLAAPTPIGPNGTISDGTPTFSWSSVSESAYYRLKVLRSNGAPYYVPEPLPVGSSYTPTTPLQSGCYDWWVRAERTSTDHGPWSAKQRVCLLPGQGKKE